MQYSNHLLRHSYPVKLFIFSMLALIFCSYSGKAGVVYANTDVSAAADTLSPAELQNIQWGNITGLIPGSNILTASLNDGRSLVIKRKDYEDYARKKQEPSAYTNTFTKVEIEPEFHGGPEAWNAYVKKNLHYPADVLKQNVSGTVIVLFVVEQDGRVTEVEAIAGPASLREEAVRLVKLSGTWNTAIQNFRIVRAYKRQPVVFARANATSN